MNYFNFQNIEVVNPVLAVIYCILLLLAILGVGRVIVSDNKCKIISFALGFITLGTITYFACMYQFFFNMSNSY